MRDDCLEVTPEKEPFVLALSVSIGKVPGLRNGDRGKARQPFSPDRTEVNITNRVWQASRVFPSPYTAGCGVLCFRFFRYVTTYGTTTIRCIDGRVCAFDLAGVKAKNGRGPGRGYYFNIFPKKRKVPYLGTLFTKAPLGGAGWAVLGF